MEFLQRKKLFLIICSIGLLLICMGMILSPSFVVNNLSPDGILEAATIWRLQIIRIVSILFGILGVILGIVMRVWTDNSSSKVRRLATFLAIIILVAFALRMVSFRGYFGSDDGYYASLAHEIASGMFKIGEYTGPPVFALRFGLIAPVAASFKIFGISEPAMLIYPFTLSMLSVILAFIAGSLLLNYKAGLIAAGIQAVLPIDAQSASLLLPDLPSAFWANLSVVVIYSAVRTCSFSAKLIFGILAGFLLAASYSCKSSVVFLLPFIVIYLVWSSIHNQQNISILFALVATFTFCLTIESLIYYKATGDLFYRFHETERNYEFAKVWFFAEGSKFGWTDGRYQVAVVRRVFIDGPKAIFVNYRYFGLVTATAVLAIGYAAFRRLRSFLFIAFWFISLAFMFNFASSSLQSYIPLVLLDRYLYPLLFPAVLLTAGLIDVLITSRGSWRQEINHERSFWGMVIVIVVIFICLSGIYRNFGLGIPTERAISRMLAPKDIIYTDSRTASILRFFWKYPQKNGISDFECMAIEDIPKGAYVLINRGIADSLNSNYGYMLPKFYTDLPNHWVLKWSSGQAELYWVPAQEEQVFQ